MRAEGDMQVGHGQRDEDMPAVTVDRVPPSCIDSPVHSLHCMNALTRVGSGFGAEASSVSEACKDGECMMWDGNANANANANGPSKLAR